MNTVVTSKKFNLGARDFLKGMLVAVLTPIVPIIYQSIDAKTLVLDWKAISLAALGGLVAYLAKNFLTPSQIVVTDADPTSVKNVSDGSSQVNIMSKVIAIIMILSISVSASSQGFFKPLSKKPEYNNLKGAHVTSSDSTFFSVRPIANIAAMSLPAFQAMAGAGIGLQNITYNYNSQRYYCNYSINGIMFAGGNIAPATPTPTLTYALMIGFLNNLIMIGPGLNGGKIQGIISIGISLNN